MSKPSTVQAKRWSASVSVNVKNDVPASCTQSLPTSARPSPPGIQQSRTAKTCPAASPGSGVEHAHQSGNEEAQKEDGEDLKEVALSCGSRSSTVNAHLSYRGSVLHQTKLVELLQVPPYAIDRKRQHYPACCRQLYDETVERCMELANACTRWSRPLSLILMLRSTLTIKLPALRLRECVRWLWNRSDQRSRGT